MHLRQQLSVRWCVLWLQPWPWSVVPASGLLSLLMVMLFAFFGLLLLLLQLLLLTTSCIHFFFVGGSGWCALATFELFVQVMVSQGTMSAVCGTRGLARGSWLASPVHYPPLLVRIQPLDVPFLYGFDAGLDTEKSLRARLAPWLMLPRMQCCVLNLQPNNKAQCKKATVDMTHMRSATRPVVPGHEPDVPL